MCLEYLNMSGNLPAKLEEVGVFDVIVDHVANGGSALELCKLWNVRYSDMMRWIYADAVKKEEYERSLAHQSEWMVMRLLDELRAIGTVDIRGAFNEDGRLKPMSEIPEAVAKAMAQVEVFEEFEWDGQAKERVQTGWTKKVKFYDKLRAIELLGKKLAMFVERHEHKHSVTLEKLVAGSEPPQMKTKVIETEAKVSDDGL